jgi:hypothetical protein
MNFRNMIRLVTQCMHRKLCTSNAAVSLQAADTPSVEVTKITNNLRTFITHFLLIALVRPVDSTSWKIFTKE